MTPRLAILYEDHLSRANPKHFGPHLLVLRCLADRTGRDLDVLRAHVQGFPRKGIGKLLADCRGSDFAMYPHVVAVCDDDRIRDHLKLATGACKLQVRAAVAVGCSWAPRLRVVLLVRNLETVIVAVRSILGLPPLTQKPTPEARDNDLLQLVWSGTADQRAELLRRVPSLGYLVDSLARLLGPADA